MSKIDNLKNKIVRQATSFTAGEFKPANESWIGNVYLYRNHEGIPLDNDGKQMFPLVQICLEGLSFIPEVLKEIKIITVFVGEEMPSELTLNGNNWLVRTYG